MEEKIKIQFSPIENNSKFDFQGQTISVKRYLSISDRVRVAEEYLSLLFGDETKEIGYRYIVAENALILEIIDISTNIDVNQLDPDILIYSDLWGTIKNRIVGYQDFRNDLNRIISLHQSEKSLEMALGNAITNVGNKLYNVIDQLSQTDAEKLKEVADNFTSQFSELNQKFPGIAGEPVKRKRGRPKKLE